MNKFSTLYIILLFVFLLSGSKVKAQVHSVLQESQKHEVRAVWLTTVQGLDWPKKTATDVRSRERQKNDLIHILDELQQAGVNTVLFQTRVRATTMYPSKIEPWEIMLTGKAGNNPGYDPLQFAIDECHKRGMEIHAWVVTIPVGKWTANGCVQLRKKYPKLLKKIGDEGFMDVENPQTATYLADLCAEITRNYDIDGIHLDYIRYPETWKIKVPLSKGRQYVTNIATAISKKVKDLKPWVKMSCSPIGKFDDLKRKSSSGWNAYTRVCQDAQGWLRDGVMDQLYPMMYFRGDNFYPFLFDWRENDYGKTVVPGLGIYFLSKREKDWPLVDVSREMEVSRQLGMGHAYFRSQFFTDNTKGLYDFAHDGFDSSLALTPPMTWAGKTAPNCPSELVTDSVESKLVWSGAKDNSGGPNLTYNVYCSRQWPVDVTKAENLVAQRLEKTEVAVPLKHGLYYAVTAMDRYGQESEAVQNLNVQPPAGNGKFMSEEYLLECDNAKVTIPSGCVMNSSDMLVILDQRGKVVKYLMMSNEINVETLVPGLYQLRTIGKKDVQHRVGFFVISPKN